MTTIPSFLSRREFLATATAAHVGSFLAAA
ncbi:hypothetical protein BH24ACI4_BH24ACI4_23950 [soil metagenome]